MTKYYVHIVVPVNAEAPHEAELLALKKLVQGGIRHSHLKATEYPQPAPISQAMEDHLKTVNNE